MWIFTSGGDPRCRYFVNSETLSTIGHMDGGSFLKSIQPEVIKGIAEEDTVLFGREAGSEKPRFLLVFRDDEEFSKLAGVQAAVRDALLSRAGVLDLEELRRTFVDP